VLKQQVEPENRNGRFRQPKPAVLAVPRPVSGKKEVLCSCEAEFGSRVAAMGSPGESTKILKAAQDEASPAVLRRKTPEAQDLLLAEREGVLRQHLPKVHDAGSIHPCDGRAKAVTAIEKLAISAENETNNCAGLESIPCPEL
jgi:hypothetical protein